MSRLSLRGYAGSRKKKGLPGGQLSSVQKAIEDNRISGPGPDGKLDSELADAEWERNTQTPADAGEQATSYHKARARREAARARLAEIQVAKEEGSLIPKEVVEDVYGTKLLDVLRSGLLNMPGRWGSQVVGLETPREGEAILKRIATELLEEFSGPVADAFELGTGAGLPEDCPALKYLVAAGVETMSELLGLEELRQVPGIGPARERRILGWLEGLGRAG